VLAAAARTAVARHQSIALGGENSANGAYVGGHRQAYRTVAWYHQRAKRRHL